MGGSADALCDGIQSRRHHGSHSPSAAQRSAVARRLHGSVQQRPMSCITQDGKKAPQFADALSKALQAGVLLEVHCEQDH